MDVVTIAIGFGLLFLLWRYQDLAFRLRMVEEARRSLEISLAELRTQISGLSASTPGPIPPAAATQVPTGPAIRTTPGPRSGRRPARAHRIGPVTPAASMPMAEGTPMAVVRLSPAAAAAPATASAPDFRETTDSVLPPRQAARPPVAPVGPTFAERLLERIGLASKDGEGPSRAAIEAWLEGRMLAVVGGIALILGAAFFLSLAFSRGWITEPMRVLIGLGGGALAIGLGELAFLRLRGIVGHVLLAVGLSIVSLSLFSATRLFGLIPPEAGVAAALLTSIVAAAIAIRHDSELVAGFGLVSVLVSPPLLGASPTLLTILFLGVALVGTTAIALFRTWVWLPPLAFLLAAPQVASSTVGGSSVAVSMLTIAGFWLLNTVAAGGEEIRHPSEQLRPSSVTLLLASTAFTLWAGMTVLDGAYLPWRGWFVAAIALADLALGFELLARFGDRHHFGLVVSATGVASLTMAAPIQLGATWVPVAWAAEAVALAWLAVRFRHPFAAAAALVIGALSLLHLVLVEYPGFLAAEGFARTWPFVGPEGATYAFLIGALAVAAALVPVAWIRVGLAIVAVLTTAYVLPFELSGPALVAAWSALTVLAMAAWRFGVVTRVRAGFVEDRVGVLALPAWAEELIRSTSSLVRPVFAWTVAIPIMAAIAHLLAFEYPAVSLGNQSISGIPYASLEGAAALAVLGGLLLTGVLAAGPARMATAGIGLMVLTWTLAFEIDAPQVLVTWGVVTIAALAVVRRLVVVDPRLPRPPTTSALGERVPFLAVAFGLVAMSIDALLYAPPAQLLSSLAGQGTLTGTAFLDQRTFALLALAATLGTLGWVWGGLGARAVGTVGAALVIAWLLPFELSPAYAVAGWAALGAGGFALVRRLPATRTLVGAPSVGLVVYGVLVAVSLIAPPSRLVVDPTTVVTGYPILTDATLALVSLAIAIGVGVRIHRDDPLSGPGAIAAALVLLYAISVGVVDVFQQQVGTRPLEDLQREAQLALSLVWSALGGIAFAIGLRGNVGAIRRAGLALLGLATVKVFIVDLASLDVAYRVLSLVGLGVLLLLSAVVYARQQGREGRTGTEA
jgi:uncharacterized membrane protein